MLTRHQVEAARARADAATPDWTMPSEHEDECYDNCVIRCPVGLSRNRVLLTFNANFDFESDMDFAVHARTDLPAALDALEAMHEMLALVLPQAKAWAHEHPVGCNQHHVNLAAVLLAAYDADAPTRAGDGGEG